MASHALGNSDVHSLAILAPQRDLSQQTRRFFGSRADHSRSAHWLPGRAPGLTGRAFAGLPWPIAAIDGESTVSARNRVENRGLSISVRERSKSSGFLQGAVFGGCDHLKIPSLNDSLFESREKMNRESVFLFFSAILHSSSSPSVSSRSPSARWFT